MAKTQALRCPILHLPDSCHPPYEETILYEGAPHQYHVCAPCIHGQIRYYLYPTLDVQNPSLLPGAASRHHARLDALTCLDHE